jgi:hypothetical protein
MQRVLFRRFAPLRQQITRQYFAIEPLDDDDDEVVPTPTSALPTASLVNGRFISPICHRGSKKSFKDVLTWLWTKKQTRLSLPSFKYHDKQNILLADADYAAVSDRSSTKMTWVSSTFNYATIVKLNCNFV